jgi:ABC-type oligopeptide transport system ATPase subunit
MECVPSVKKAMKPLLKVEGLKVHFPVRAGILQRVVDQVKAVDGISFEVPRGKTVGLVGESGSGKTTTGRAIARLVPVTAGSIQYNGKELVGLRNREFSRTAKKSRSFSRIPLAP